jgi:hypothetical protein
LQQTSVITCGDETPTARLLNAIKDNSLNQGELSRVWRIGHGMPSTLICEVPFSEEYVELGYAQALKARCRNR